MRHRLYHQSHPILSALFAPWVRFDESGPGAKVWAVAWIVVQALWQDLFMWLLVLLALAHATDWYFGRAAALAEDRFNESMSAWGLQSKVASIMQVLIVRALELALATNGVANTQGMFAVAATAALIYQDVESIEGHRAALGGRPIPVLHHVLTGLNAITQAVLPQDLRPDPPPGVEEEDPDCAAADGGK